MEIKNERLMNNLFSLAQIGRNSAGGIDRWFGSEKDIEAREWLLKYWKAVFPKARVVTDGIGNLWVKTTGLNDLAPIVLGSHHDAVPCGGKYDGALGVLMATEVMETLNENHITLRHPLYIISFTGEEPNPFNLSTLGSKVLAGRLTQKDLLKCFNRDNGESLEAAIDKAGGNIHCAGKIKQGEIAAFIECHIEQGHRLEDLNLSVASVTAITGIYREEITFFGEANHAGTTVIGDRKDAFLAACDFALQVEKELQKYPDGTLVGTIGHIEMKPNEVNIIPEELKFIIDIRTCRKEILKKMLQKMDNIQEIVQKHRGIRIRREIILNQPCIPMDQEVISAIDAGIAMVQEPPMRLESMAGHDAANMAGITKSGMIFVKSTGGKSHCKEEYTPPEDIKKAGDVMLHALMELDRKLDREEKATI